MSETKWTPGPWSLEDNHIVSGAVRVAVADTPDIHGGVNWIECDYNARLIAAAPELYDALEECKRVLSDLQSTQLEGTRTRAAWEKARAALAKARGE